MQFATTLANAQAGTAIDLTSAGGPFGVVKTLAVSTSANTITIPAHGFLTADRVMVAVNSGATLPTGLSAQTAYFVTVVDANTIKLADTAAHAKAGTNAITLSGAGNGALSVFRSTLINAAAVGYHALACQQVNAATAASNIVGLY